MSVLYDETLSLNESIQRDSVSEKRNGHSCMILEWVWNQGYYAVLDILDVMTSLQHFIMDYMNWRKQIWFRSQWMGQVPIWNCFLKYKMSVKRINFHHSLTLGHATCTWFMEPLKQALRSHHGIFTWDSPARREDYFNLTGSDKYPLQFCWTWWVEDKKRSERLVNRNSIILK